MKRFYKDVAQQAVDAGYLILLDGKPIKTPAQSPLLVPPSAALAQAIAEEWASQIEVIQPETMPLTQWIITQIDRVTPQREKLQNEILGYIDTDLLCYRAPPDSDIGKLQEAAWDPILDWITKIYGMRALTTTALEALQQPDNLHKTLQAYAATLSDQHFAVLYVLTCETGSLFLGLAVLNRAFSNDAIFAAARAEEDYKKTLYHEDIHGSAPDQEKREEKLRQELATASLFLDLIRDKPL